MESDVPPPNLPPPPPPPVPPVLRHRPVPPPQFQAPLPPRPSSGGSGWMVLAIVLIVVVGGIFGLTVLGSLLGAGPATMSVSGSRHGLLMQTLENNGSRNEILVIELDGVIMGGSVGRGPGIVEFVKDQLEVAKKRDSVKAVILRVDSPGGEVMPSDDIAALIAKFQKDSPKPVVAQMGSVAASGGYYVSAPCRWIVANKLTITGSIGVIMSGYNYRGLMDKVGVRPEVFKSGQLKDMLSSAKKDEDITPEERQIVMSMIMETYGAFTNVVAEGRAAAWDRNKGAGRKLSGSWLAHADGRILTGHQAYELGFVDELGNFDTAVARAKTLANVPDANLIQFQAPFDLSSLFRIFGQSEAKTVKIDLGVETLRLKQGYLYFLMPTAL